MTFSMSCVACLALSLIASCDSRSPGCRCGQVSREAFSFESDILTAHTLASNSETFLNESSSSDSLILTSIIARQRMRREQVVTRPEPVVAALGRNTMGVVKI